MQLDLFVTSTGEMWLLGAMLLFGAGALLFTNEVKYVIVGIVAIVGVGVITYSNHTNTLEERFTLEQFHKGKALSCGVWRGETILVDPSKGWKYDKRVGFTKGDVIINNPGVCKVIEKASPQPSTLPYWMIFGALIGILMILKGFRSGFKTDSTLAEDSHGE